MGLRIAVGHEGINDLQRDLARIGPEFYRQGRAIVKDTVRDGGTTARRIARLAAGPHGGNYYKRITWDRSAGAFVGFGGGEIAAEYGPTGRVVGNAVGAGWRNGPPNTDLEQSLDLIRPQFHRRVEHMLDDLFWPGA